MMNRQWSYGILFLSSWILCGCQNKPVLDGNIVESRIVAESGISLDFINRKILQSIIDDINCADSALLKKKIVLAENFHSADTTEILLIPFMARGEDHRSYAFSDLNNRLILINPGLIREFTLNNTLNDSISFQPVLELMLLHETGHFILRKAGVLDAINSTNQEYAETHIDNSQPEYITSLKKIELSADSLAIDLVKRKLNGKYTSCLNIAFDIERVIPGMQFQMSGRRMIDNFGAPQIGFLHDPSNVHPNMELRITYMDYFLYPSAQLKQMIDDYIYNRTVAPVHRQEFDPRIFQGKEKDLSK